MAKVLELQLQSFQWIFRADFLWDWLVWSPCSPRDSQESSPGPQFKSIKSLVLSLLYSPVLTSEHDYWKNHSIDYTYLFFFWPYRSLSAKRCLCFLICCLGLSWGFSGGSDGKEPAGNAGDPGLIPGSGRSPGEGNGNPLQYSCLENPMDREVWQATVHTVTKNWTQLSD